MQIYRNILLLITFVFLGCFHFSLAQVDKPAELKVFWKMGAQSKQLKSWTLTELLNWKLDQKREKVPQESSVALWEGVDFNKLIDVALEGVTLHERGEIDLVLLKGQDNKVITVPRSFIRKFSFLLAIKKNGKPLTAPYAPFFSVVPVSSLSAGDKRKLDEEIYPLHLFSVTGIKEITFTRVQDQYGSLFLRRKTNPLALRGERVFVWNCNTCHAMDKVSPDPRWSKAIESSELFKTHKNKGLILPDFNRLDRLGLIAYFEQHQKENPKK